MRPTEWGALDRDTIFGVYLRPRKKPPAAKTPLTPRQTWLAHGKKIGKSWLQIEADWQAAHRRGK
jgi:hypothetical protein